HVKQAGHPLPAGADLKRISVQSGDTLGKIAKDHNLDPDALEKANPKITDPDNLRAGQTIVIPSAKATPNAAPAGSNPSQKSAPNATQPGKPQQGGSLSDDAPAEREAAEAETETGTEAGTETQSEPEKPVVTPEQEYMNKAVSQPVDPVEHTLLKSASVLTEKEVDSMIGHNAYWLDGGRHPLGDPLQKKTKDLFDNLYPEPQGGRAFTPPAEPRPLAISHEVPLSHGRKVVADDLSNKAPNSNIPDAVRGLQTTLNKRGYGNPQHILPHLKEDGDFGPRTLARLDEELLRGGPSSVIRDLNGMAVA
ncbi:MAG: LysM domain-containing protein, partial [Pseudomonadota bacterium]|nr:LysM domain-containing protein [Pseudomonadota bacterium]